jgi:hypothetical protein
MVGYGSFFVLRCTLDTAKFDIIINIIGYVSIVLTDICRSFLRVSKVTAKIKTRSKPTPSENFNSHPLQPLLFTFILLGTATPQARLPDPLGGRDSQVENH